MHPDWRSFLAARGAPSERPDGTRTAAAGSFRDTATVALFDLSHLGLIAVRGDDAETFLQGQLTNDIRALTPTHSHLTAHCSPKGRMLACFRALRLRDAVALQVPQDRLADTLKRLRMYVLRARVQIADASDDFVRIGLAGNQAFDLLAHTGLPVPERDNEVAVAGATTILRLPGPLPRCELFGDPAGLGAIWDALSPACTLGDSDAWALHNIRAGLPTVYTATADAFVPQMTNLQLIDGVSFSKGCYTGQEVVARMQYLGKLKRRMYVGQVQSSVRPRPGDALGSPASDSEQGAGRIVDARPLGGERYALLAVVEIEAAEAGEVRLGEGGPVVSLEPPPYGFSSEASPERKPTPAD
jgi:tRNA-modifying protein YgfZ